MTTTTKKTIKYVTVSEDFQQFLEKVFNWDYQITRTDEIFFTEYLNKQIEQENKELIFAISDFFFNCRYDLSQEDFICPMSFRKDLQQLVEHMTQNRRFLHYLIKAGDEFLSQNIWFSIDFKIPAPTERILAQYATKEVNDLLQKNLNDLMDQWQTNLDQFIVAMKNRGIDEKEATEKFKEHFFARNKNIQDLRNKFKKLENYLPKTLKNSLFTDHKNFFVREAAKEFLN